MNVTFLVACILLCFTHSTYSSRHSTGFRDYELYRRYFNSEGALCREVLNCEECRLQSSCQWCRDEQGVLSKCKPKQNCPVEQEDATCSSAVTEDYETRENTAFDLLDVPQVTLNQSTMCARHANCSQCTNSSGLCAWCNKKKACIAYYNASTTTSSCQSNLWYKDQCIYSATTTPCPLRQPECRDCLKDDLCYWCGANKKCSFYPSQEYRPDDCPIDETFHGSCSHMKLYIVLIPILCIVFIPVITYLVLWIITCCIQANGYDELSDTDSSDDRKPKKDKKPIKLQHASPRSKTDELKKKYGLGKP